MTIQVEQDSAIAELLRREGLDTVAGAFAYTGGQDMPKPGLGSRSRTKVLLRDDNGQPHVVFLKRYGRESFVRRLRQWLSGGRGVSRARVEVEAIEKVRRAGVPTMESLAFGEEMGLLGERRSYLVVSCVKGEAISRCGDAFFERHASNPQMLGQFSQKLCALAAAFHAAGLAHRDFYASHIFLHEQDAALELSLIDLARVFAPTQRRLRWVVKDLAGLKYSMPPAWVTPCWDRFLCDYLAATGPMGRGMGGWARAINIRVRAMQAKARRRQRRNRNVANNAT